MSDRRHIAYLLARAHRSVSGRLATDLKPLGLSVDMWIVLDALHVTPGLPMTQIADDLCHNLPTVTKLIDRMVSDNLVYRKPHRTDRRRVLIFPTSRGLDLAAEAGAIAKALETKETLPSDIAGLQQALRGLAIDTDD